MKRTKIKSEMALESQDTNGTKRDEQLLLQIIPAEIWLNVVTAAFPNDVLNIRQSSQFLASLLTPVEFLFAPVLKCVMFYISDDYKRYRVLKNCRLACRSWCKAVNSVLQEESPHTRIETGRFSILPQHPYHLQHFRIKFLNQQNMLPRFENHFEDTHLEKGKNPFVTRHVEICYSSSNSRDPEYLLHLYKILKMCGRHIWYLNVLVTSSNPNNGFQELRDLLELLPNLKVLTIYNVPMFAPTKTESPNLQPFPNYPKLQCVKTHGDQSEALLKALLTNNRQVKSIVFCQPRERSRVGDGWVRPSPKLERLRVTSYTMSDFQKIGNEQVNWPLKQFVANLMNMQAVNWQEMGRIFQILETKFGNTLGELDLYFPHVHEVNTNFTLHLPHLTSLSLELTFCYSLDFLLPLKTNLKFLYIRVDCTFKYLESSAPSPVIEEKTIRFFTVDNPPIDTNIWRLFTKLEKLKYWHRFDHHKEMTYYRENRLLN